ncbi:hypothetical protein [Sporosarcina sp. YIM B06819]|nr:hypothetical protein [Sporosarcina sp. YIM B06819]
MKISKVFRASMGGVVMLLMTFVFLPVLAVNPDIEILQSFINYINKE